MTDATIAASSLIADARPYVALLVNAVVCFIGWLITLELKKYTGLAVDQALLAKVEKYIEDKAAQAVAGAADNLAHATIDVHSPLVAEIATKIITSIPDELAAVGLSPEAVAHKLTAAFGNLQSRMTAVPVPVPPPVAK